MHNWNTYLQNAWDELIIWYESGKFEPINEEDIQCFLYRSLVNQADSALEVKPKPTTGKPDKLRFSNGKLLTGNMHFPDFILGDLEIVIEIKFATGDSRRKARTYNSFKKDIEKMLKYHPEPARYAIFFDDGKSENYMDDYQLNELGSIDPDCNILYYPVSLSNNPMKAVGRKAITTMRENGVDFQQLGRANAKKGINKQ